MFLPLRFAVPLLVRPFATWRAIASRRMPLAALALGYVLPLAAIGPVATYLARTVVGYRYAHVVYRDAPSVAFAEAALRFGLALAGMVLVASLVYLFAPLFGAERHFLRSLKVAAFASTPAWLAAALVLIPALGFAQLLALAYEIFLLHAGLATLLGVPRGRAGGLAACAVVGTILIAVGLGELTAVFAGGG